jgi:molybdopterin-guanine dinucleotide biosynthesis protein A
MSIAITILAGGRSSRFGEDKRFFKLHGKSLIHIAIEKAESLNLKTYISVDKGSLPAAGSHLAGYNLIVDEYDYKGPLAAIVSSLGKIGEEKAIFIPVDMPLVSVEFLSFIKEQDCELVYSVISEKVYPLPSLVSKSALNELEDLVRSDDLALNKALKRISYNHNTCLIDEKAILKFGEPESIFYNINYREDLEYLR